MKRPEVLAPAGNITCLWAAVSSGADAVYLGGKNYNLRRRAVNFTESELAIAVKYAHARGVKVYITVNSPVFNKDLPVMADFVTFLNGLEVDAFIVQDLAVLEICRRLAPEVPVHISSAVNIHNLSGARLMKNSGVKRVIFTEEMYLRDVERIKQEVGIETEVFVNGEYCLAYAGSCLLTTYFYGLPPSLGRCLRPCRLSYLLTDRAGKEIVNDREIGPHLLCTKDLSLLEHIPSLILAEVDGLKIEGRRKPPEYVALVTSVYRELIDLYFQDRLSYRVTLKHRQKIQLANLGDVASGYYFGDLGRGLMSYWDVLSSGVFVGRVKTYLSEEQKAVISLENSLQKGDVIEIRLPDNSRHKFTVDEDKEALQEAEISLKEAVLQGAEVYKVYDSLLVKDVRQKWEKEEVLWEEIKKDVSLTSQKCEMSFSFPKIERQKTKTQLAVKVSCQEALEEAVKAKADIVYWGGENFSCPKELASVAQLQETSNFCRQAGVKFCLTFPAIIKDHYMEQVADIFNNLEQINPDGLLVGNWGVLQMAVTCEHAFVYGGGHLAVEGQDQQIPIYLDYQLNLFNSLALEKLKEYKAVKGFCLSPKISFSALKELIPLTDLEVEAVIGGKLPLLISEHCLIQSVLGKGKKVQECASFCSGDFAVKNTAEKILPLATNQFCQLFIYPEEDFVLKENLQFLVESGINRFRLELGHLKPSEIREKIRFYR